MAALDLSICTVLYRSEALTRRFHEELTHSLKGHTHYELLYYDHSPIDALRADLTRGTAAVHYTWDARNLGFSFGNNQLIRRARHARVLLLNPDVFGFKPAFWERLARHPSGRVTFVRLLETDGRFQDCCGDTVGLTRALRPRKDYSREREPVEVGMGIMAFMLTERDTFDRVGLLDEDYPLYGEDMDWCYRARRAGVKLVFDPTLELTHVGGASAADRWSRRASLERKYAAERVFVRKHFRGLHRAALLALNRVKLLRLAWQS
jgi:GT2 family glycosyltransferase